MHGEVQDLPLSLLQYCVVLNQGRKVDDCIDLESLQLDSVGLSKSRNRALQHALAENVEVMLITDNDTSFHSEVIEILSKTFRDHPEADVICFKATTTDGDDFKRNYKNSVCDLDLYSSASVSSIEIAIRVKSLKGTKLTFDESFGLGSDYPSGEEYIFLTDAIKDGLKVVFVPEVIVSHPLESSGKDYDNSLLLKAKGAMLARVFGLKSILFCVLFSLKKAKLFKLKIVKNLFLMLSGALSYIYGK